MMESGTKANVEDGSTESTPHQIYRGHKYVSAAIHGDNLAM